ncbi:hypothetical protein [Kitasatospora kifunensis]|uniref:Uncharacterized protein n=1 Tax=Kitasatospora kifunensis TaxID=58351 RepID=A0A7W7RBQ5_KITKI|nr:hypothetical protein [Kitasatospora kifunensis]MBB4929080.1 hypothetical protein [Kitasatospora kifunensis]
MSQRSTHALQLSQDQCDEDRYEAEAQNRRRQAADLEHIATYYALESRLDIRVALGGRVRNNGREGAIVDTIGQRLMVLFNGDEAPCVRHVTSGMTYETATGWIAATPAPDPWASADRGRAKPGSR